MVLTAKEWGWSPTAIIRGADDPRAHDKADYNFAHAVHVLTEEKCPKCGVPIWHAYSEDSAVAFKLREVDCYACAHKETEEEQSKDKAKPGQSKLVYPVPEEGFEKLPSRGDFYEREHHKHVKALEAKIKAA